MNEDRHREKLKKALNALPTYQPEESVWEGIRHQLDLEEQQTKFQAALQSLPTYEPPAEVWTVIESGLEKNRHARVRIRWMRLGAAAAILAGLALALPWLSSFKNVTQIKIVYSEEIGSSVLPSSWNEDEEAIALLVRTAEARPDFLPNDYHHLLMQELEELSSAKTELQEAIDLYGINDQLAREMAEIERARTDILEEMAAQI